MADLDPIFQNIHPAERRKLLAIYTRAQTQLSAWAVHPSATKTGSADYRATAAMARLRQVDEVVALLKRETAKATGRIVSSAATTGGRLANEDIRRIRTKATADPRVPSRHTIAVTTQQRDATFALVQHDAIRVVARDMASDLVKGADSMGETVKKILRQTSQEKLSESDIEALIANRLITGDRTLTIRLLKDDLIRAHEGKLVAVPTKGGGMMHFEAGKYAEMVVRTKTAQAVTEGQRIQYEREGIDLVVIDGARSKNPCTEFLGTVYSISGNHPKYPPLRTLPGGGPPFHPNCTKGIIAYIEELATPAQRNAAEPDPMTARIARAGNTQEGIKLYRNLQRPQVVQERMRGITPSAGPKARVTAQDDPAFLKSQLSSLGIEEVSIGNRTDIAAEAVKAAQRVVSSGGTLPKTLSIDGSRIGNDPAGYDPRADTVYLNPRWPDWRDLGKVTAQHAPGTGDGLWSSGSRLHPLLHELAHPAIHRVMGEEAYQSLRTREWRRGEITTALEVSKYAADQPLEFVQETHAALSAGRKFSPEVMNLYHRLKGQR